MNARRALPPLLAAAAVAALAACSMERSGLNPAGPAAHTLSSLGWPVLLGFLATTGVMWGILLWVTTRRTGSFAEHAPIDSGGGQRWILIGGFALPGIAFAAIFVATLRTMDTFPMEHHAAHGAAEEPDLVVTGHQWWWSATYVGGSLQDRFTTANEIHVPAGTPVDIALVTADVIHSFWVPRLHGKVDLVPGMVNRIRIEADRPGTYEGECAEYCGLQHAHMRFLLVADPPDAYRRWRENERSMAFPPVTAAAQRGQKVFLNAACVLCHTVRGTSAHGSVGPDLTHLAGRRTLAANSFPKDVATLHAWVTNAPSLKPGIRMPALTQFTGPELHDLVDYLQSLK